MVSIEIIFWVMILFFALIGYLRGWPKEVIALTGLVASIAALNQFGFQLASLVGAATTPDAVTAADPFQAEQARLRQQFWIQTLFHLAIAFFSYQGVARLASQVAGGRLGDRARAGLERKVLGALIGAVNGYLVVGGIWSFLEYRMSPAGYVQLEPGVQYAFDIGAVARPFLPGTLTPVTLTQYLPLGFLSPTWWLVLFFGAFFLVIIALI